MEQVLMPCRALEAFGPVKEEFDRRGLKMWVLMPCRALEAFGPGPTQAGPTQADPVLMPCRALEAFGLYEKWRASQPQP